MGAVRNCERKSSVAASSLGLIKKRISELCIAPIQSSYSLEVLRFFIFPWKKTLSSQTEASLPSDLAEVDYLAARQGKVFPLEVKAGKSGSLKSLHRYLQEYGGEGVVLQDTHIVVRQSPVTSVLPCLLRSRLVRAVDHWPAFSSAIRIFATSCNCLFHSILDCERAGGE